jgi:hypothetical protein
LVGLVEAVPSHVFGMERAVFSKSIQSRKFADVFYCRATWVKR